MAGDGMAPVSPQPAVNNFVGRRVWQPVSEGVGGLLQQLVGHRRAVITREENEGLMEAMAARVKAHPEKMALRKQLVGHPFGTIKRWFGYIYFLVRGLERVRGEWTLMTLCYNLKRVLNIVSFADLMKAVQARANQPA